MSVVYAVMLLSHANVFEIDSETLAFAGRIDPIPIRVDCQATNEPEMVLDVLLSIIIIELNAGRSSVSVCSAPLVNR